MEEANIIIKILELLIPLLRDILLVLLGGFTGGLYFWKFWYKKEKRFFTNVQKPFIIYRLTKNDADMESELEMLYRNGLFSTPSRVLTDPRSLDFVKGQSLVVIAIDKETREEEFRNLYDKIKNENIPVIIYTIGDTKIDLCESDIVKTYARRVIATQPLRLVSDIFTILATTPTENEMARHSNTTLK